MTHQTMKKMQIYDVKKKDDTTLKACYWRIRNKEQDQTIKSWDGKS